MVLSRVMLCLPKCRRRHCAERTFCSRTVLCLVSTYCCDVQSRITRGQCCATCILRSGFTLAKTVPPSPQLPSIHTPQVYACMSCQLVRPPGKFTFSYGRLSPCPSPVEDAYAHCASLVPQVDGYLDMQIRRRHLIKRIQYCFVLLKHGVEVQKKGRVSIICTRSYSSPIYSLKQS